MSEWRKIWPNGLPGESRSPRSGHRMAAEGMQFPRRWNGGTISLNLGVIWEMSALWARVVFCRSRYDMVLALFNLTSILYARNGILETGLVK